MEPTTVPTSSQNRRALRGEDRPTGRLRFQSGASTNVPGLNSSKAVFTVLRQLHDTLLLSLNFHGSGTGKSFTFQFWSPSYLPNVKKSFQKTQVSQYKVWGIIVIEDEQNHISKC